MNQVEAWKAAKHGFDVWGDVEAHARAGTPMSQIAAADLERMKWYGIFCRGPAGDGHFMIRVRIPGCELTAPQAHAVAEVGRLGERLLDVTTRGNLEVSGLRITDLPDAAARLEAEGLSARQTGHDNVRNVMTHPWAGLDPEELVDVRPLCRALTDVFLGSRPLADLPREVNLAVDGRRAHSARCWAQDTGFVAARRVDGSVAFRWLLAGTEGPGSRPAWAVPAWVREDQAADVLRQTLHLYREQGPREDRDRARLRDFVDQLGVAEFLRRVEARLGYGLERTVASAPPFRARDDFVGWFPQKQRGLWAIGVHLPGGRLTREQLAGLADLAELYGDGTLRTAYGQGVAVPNLPAHSKLAALRMLGRLGLTAEAGPIAGRPLAPDPRRLPCTPEANPASESAFACFSATP